MDDIIGKHDDLVQLARLALVGREQDVTLYVQRLARRLRKEEPDVADALTILLRENPTRSSPLRRVATPIPVDSDSRLALVRVEDPPLQDDEPILSASTKALLQQVVDERIRISELEAEGLAPTRTALLLGPPGVGKTMAARWMAMRLGYPLLVLDLSAVMSSLLGRTGVNLRHVLDYAKSNRCVLLLDELDSIGKRRDDDADIGELKRLVNVLLQQIDDWPANGGLLLGATNHPELLDPAIWRRFEATVDFPLPDEAARGEAIRRFSDAALPDKTELVLGRAFAGRSFSEIEIALGRARRASALGYGSIEECATELCADYARRLPPAERRRLAASLVSDVGISQRRAHELTGVSRDTIRKTVKSGR